MPCCDGDENCPKCQGRGYTLLTDCPHKMVPAHVRAAIHAVDLLEKGLPPVAGGSLDQTVSFTQALMLVGEIDAANRARAAAEKPPPRG